MTDDGGPVARVDGARLLQRLDELAAIGRTARGGVTRLAWSREDVRARGLVAEWMSEAGLEPRVDAATNLIGDPAGGRGPFLVSGSHLDTVVEAGPLDGAYGVLAAVEVATALHEAGVETRRPLRVVAFSNEEGARGSLGMLGSRAIVDRVPPWALGPDDDGVDVAKRLVAAGGDPDGLASAVWPAGSVAGLIELHIEQGPVLEAAGVTIGVVPGITGQCHVDLLVEGQANHAGTTPMDLRADAAAAGAEIILAVEAMARAGATRVATAGYVTCEPNVRNVIAGRVVIGLDIRDLDDGRVEAFRDELDAQLRAVAARRRVSITPTAANVVPAVRSDATLLDAIEAAATALGHGTLSVPSGAGHDAQVMAAIAPVAMIFVPSEQGVSHAPGEHSRPEHLVAGAEVLLQALLDADGRLP